MGLILSHHVATKIWEEASLFKSFVKNVLNIRDNNFGISFVLKSIGILTFLHIKCATISFCGSIFEGSNISKN